MNESKNAFRAGLVVIAGVAIAVAFFVASRKSTLDRKNSHLYYAYLVDASGITAKSLITVAGLQVGEIQEIRLVDVKLGELLVPKPGEAEEGAATKGGEPIDPERVVKVARVDMRIIKELGIPKDTWLKKESLGVLGAKALFLELGESRELIPPGGRILNVRSQTGLDALQSRAEEIVATLESIVKEINRDIGGIVEDVHGITTTLSRFIQGEGDTPPLNEVYEVVMEEVRKVVVTIERAVRDVNGLLTKNDAAVTGLLANLESISGDIAELTSGPGRASRDGGPMAEGDLRRAMSQIRRVADDLATITGTLKEIVGENEDEVDKSVKELKHTLAELNRSLTSLAEVTGRIERGEGTVGRLLTDERMADKLEEAVAGASDFLVGLTSLETHVDLGTWYNVQAGSAQVSFELRLQPKPDKYYLIGIVDDGGGIERITRTFNPPSAGEEVTRTTIREDDNTLRFTAMFAKRFWDFLVLRAGLLETSGGVGANLLFWDDRIELRSDLFNFGGPRNKVALDDPAYPGYAWPRWRTMLKIQPIPHLYLMGGVDDVLNFRARPAEVGYGFDYFFGAGVTFRDEDLRSILPFVPSF